MGIVRDILSSVSGASAWETRYYEVAAQLGIMELQYMHLRAKWDALITRINAKGGERFLENARISTAALDIEAEDIDKLLQLCHPDKHGGKRLAQDMTAKLLALREKL